MDRYRPKPKRDRPLFLDILIIGAAIAALMYGGLHLLGKTRNAWDARNAERQTRAESIQLAAQTGIEERRRDLAAERLEQIRAEQARQDARLKNRRCVGGVLFAEIDGVLTNIGRC